MGIVVSYKAPPVIGKHHEVAGHLMGKKELGQTPC